MSLFILPFPNLLVDTVCKFEIPADIYCVVIVWPEGTYGLPKPAVTGCPPNWQEGWRNQDLENTNPSSEFSVGLTSRMDATLTGGDIRRGFCVKTATQIGETSWPAGK